MASLDALVEDLRHALASHRPIDEQERTSLAALAEQLDALPRPFDEDAGPVHVTSSALVVSARGIILHKHKRLGIWIQPGGHINDGERPEDAAIREVLEETGLTTTHFSGRPTIVHVDVHPAPKGHTHLDLRYLLRSPADDPTPPAGESPDVAWLSFENALALADGGLSGLMATLTQPSALQPAQENDATGIAECYLDAYNHALPGIVRPHTDDEVRAWVRDVLMTTTDVTLARHPLGMITGFMAVTSGWIEQFYVDPAWQGRGIGPALLTYAFASQTDLQLWTFQQNMRAQRFYECHGFVEVERTDGAGNEEHAPDIRYRWWGGNGGGAV